MFHSFQLLRRFRIAPRTLAAFVDDVSGKYQDNHFHDFRHAFTVTHVAWLLVERGELRPRKMLDDLDTLGLLLSALCHVREENQLLNTPLIRSTPLIRCQDLDHGGVTNAFEINTESDLARLCAFVACSRQPASHEQAAQITTRAFWKTTTARRRTTCLTGARCSTACPKRSGGRCASS